MKILFFFLTLAASAQTIQPKPVTISVPCQQQPAPPKNGKYNLVMCPNTITFAPITLPPIPPTSIKGNVYMFDCDKTDPHNIKCAAKESK